MNATARLVGALWGRTDFRRAEEEARECDQCGREPRRRLEQFDESGDWLCEECLTDAMNELEAVVNDRVAALSESTLDEVVS